MMGGGVTWLCRCSSALWGALGGAQAVPVGSAGREKGSSWPRRREGRAPPLMFLQPTTPLPAMCQPPVGPDSGAASSFRLGHLRRPTDSWLCGNSPHPPAQPVEGPRSLTLQLLTPRGRRLASLPLESRVGRASPRAQTQLPAGPQGP